MSLNTAASDGRRIMGLLGILGASLLAWVGSQFAPLPSKTTMLETRADATDKRLDRFEVKLDKILDAVSKP